MVRQPSSWGATTGTSTNDRDAASPIESRGNFMVWLLEGTSAEEGLGARNEANLPPLKWTAGPLEEIRADGLAGALRLPQKRGGQTRFIKTKLLNISGDK